MTADVQTMLWGRLRAAVVASVLTALAFAMRVVVVSDLNASARTSIVAASVLFAAVAAAVVPRERASTRLALRTGSAALFGLLVVLGVLSGGIQLGAAAGGLVALHFVAAYLEGPLLAATAAVFFVSVRR